jgi:hypothetical protein
VAFALHMSALSSAERSALQKAVTQLGPDALDWQSAAKRELESLRPRFSRDPGNSTALTRITSAYIDVINSPSQLSRLKETIDAGPRQVTDLIPSAERVLQEKQDLHNKLAQTRSLLQ